ncbi:MAG TPA: ester cyclase [Ktedonobacteraceae bacterium]
MYLKEDLGGVGYLVGDTDVAICAVVDPRLDTIDDILERAAAKGMRITAVIESQLHADSVSGSRELARRTGATIYVHERAAVDYPHQKLPDGIFRLFSASGASTTRLTDQGELVMSPEANALLVGRYLEEVIHRGNVDAIDESIATNHHLTWPGSPTPMCGPEGFKYLLIIYDSAFPDLQWKTEEVTAQGDTVVARLLARGTHQRELMGMPPTGKRVTWTETHIFRVAGGKLVEHWTNLDQVSMLQQFGVLP